PLARTGGASAAPVLHGAKCSPSPLDSNTAIWPRVSGASRAVVAAAATARGDAGGDECFDVLALRMAHRDIAEGRHGGGGAHLEVVKMRTPATRVPSAVPSGNIPSSKRW